MPNPLRTRTTKLLGVIVSTASTTRWFRGFCWRLKSGRTNSASYEIILAQTLNREEREQACIERLLSRRVDWFVCVAGLSDAAGCADLSSVAGARGAGGGAGAQRAVLPAVSRTWRRMTLPPAKASPRHLLELGHRYSKKLKHFFGGPSQPRPWSQERFEGYRQALRDAELTVQDQLVFQRCGQHD